MSAYQEKLLAHIEANDDFILPENRRNEILSKLKEPLRWLYTLNPQSYILNPKLWTVMRSSQSSRSPSGGSTPSTVNHTHYKIQNTQYTLHSTQYTIHHKIFGESQTHFGALAPLHPLSVFFQPLLVAPLFGISRLRNTKASGRNPRTRMQSPCAEKIVHPQGSLRIPHHI